MNHKEMVLVSGGTGFVSIHIILQLLKKDYKVKTTLRSLERKNEVIDMLKNGGIPSCHGDQIDNLEFIEADLMKDDNWDEAVKGCDFVLHVASPFPITQPQNDDELIIPAKEGTLRILKASRDANVKRVVMTSSFAAIGYSINTKNHIFTENDWTDPNTNIAAYVKSKTLAELAAWDFIHKVGGQMELTVINPVLILGPVLSTNLSTSIQMIEQLFSSKIPAVPKISYGIVDVRDVADIHIRAMISPKAKGQRFLAASECSLSLPEIAGILRTHQNKFNQKVTVRAMPDWMLKFAAYFKPELKSVSSQVGKIKIMSNEKARKVLGWQPRNAEISVIDTAESLIKFGIIN